MKNTSRGIRRQQSPIARKGKAPSPARNRADNAVLKASFRGRNLPA